MESVAGFASDDYRISLIQGHVPSALELQIQEPNCIITMQLNASSENFAYIVDMQEAEESALGGLFMIFPGRTMHFGGNTGPIRAFNCILSGRHFYRMMAGRARLTDEQLVRAFDLRSEAVSFCMRQLMRETIRTDGRSEEVIDALISVLVLELSRELFGRERANEDSRCALTEERLEKIMGHIESYPLGIPNVAEIAAQCGLSTRYFCQQFRERTGQSIGRFIAGSRLRRAERLLTETSLPLKEIAYRLGFANSATFSTAFRNEMEVPPGTYREQWLSSFAALAVAARKNSGESARIEFARRSPTLPAISSRSPRPAVAHGERGRAGTA